jgi:hypothetical protein
LVGWCNLTANALGEIELYLLRALRAAIVAWRPREEKYEHGNHHQQNASDPKKVASRPMIPDALPSWFGGFGR